MEQDPPSSDPSAPETPAPVPPPAGGPTSPDGPPSKDATNMALLAHLLGLFTSVIGPLIIWLIKKDEDAFIEDQSKEALNFQITVLLISVVLGIAPCITFGLIFFLYPLIIPVFIIGIIVLCIVATVKAGKGEKYRYPLTLRLIK